MPATPNPTSMDEAITNAFGEPLDALHAQAAAETARPALRQAMEMRSFLAVVEEQFDQVRARIHQATAPGTMPHPEDLASDLQWLSAIHRARTNYTRAIAALLRAMPSAPPAPVIGSRPPAPPMRTAHTTAPAAPPVPGASVPSTALPR